MKCLQVATVGGAARLGLLEGARVRVLAKPHDGVATTLDLLVAADEGGLDAVSWKRAAESAGAFEEMAWADLDAGRLPSKLTVPLTPSEVWGAGVTYKRSADFREEGSGIYDKVYDADRPELFFKATAARCAGPGWDAVTAKSPSSPESRTLSSDGPPSFMRSLRPTPPGCGDRRSAGS